MACTRPIYVKSKNGKGVQIRCGKCRECKIRDIKDWAFRNRAELRNASNGVFLTLTYADEDPEFNGELQISHVRTFLKNLRSKVDYEYRKGEKVPQIAQNRSNLRFFAVGEYGDKFNRPHYHMLLYNIPTFRINGDKGFREKIAIHQILQDVWTHGLIDIGEINFKSINYVCKYIFKENNARIMSKNPAIGKCYLNENTLIWHQEDKRFYMTNEDGYKQAIPDYYNRKVFDDADRADHREKNIKEPENLSAEENIKAISLRIQKLVDEERQINNLKHRKK